MGNRRWIWTSSLLWFFPSKKNARHAFTECGIQSFDIQAKMLKRNTKIFFNGIQQKEPSQAVVNPSQISPTFRTLLVGGTVMGYVHSYLWVNGFMQRERCWRDYLCMHPLHWCVLSAVLPHGPSYYILEKQLNGFPWCSCLCKSFSFTRRVNKQWRQEEQTWTDSVMPRGSMD